MADRWLTSEVPTIRSILRRKDAMFRLFGGEYAFYMLRHGPSVGATLDLALGRRVEARYYGGDFFDVIYGGRIYTFPWDPEP